MAEKLSHTTPGAGGVEQWEPFIQKNFGECSSKNLNLTNLGVTQALFDT